jgi:hypothetical protein
MEALGTAILICNDWKGKKRDKKKPSLTFSIACPRRRHGGDCSHKRHSWVQVVYGAEAN